MNEPIRLQPPRGRRLILLVAVAAGLLLVWNRRGLIHPPLSAPPTALVKLNGGDRVLILAPHPDDEVLGCAGIIQDAVARKLPVRVVFFTYGDNNEWAFALYRKHPVLEPEAVQAMGQMRRREAIAAAQVLGLDPSQLVFLGYPDFGTLQMWLQHWGGEPPYRSMLTRVEAIPYENALRPGAPYKAEEILRDLETIIGEFKPTKIFVSHPADRHPDHRALYLFTRVACWNLERVVQPELHPYLVHFPGWPVPPGYHPESALAPPAFFSRQVNWEIHPLTQPEVDRKHLALQAHETQLKAGPNYLLAFVRQNELFGDFATAELPESVLESAGPDSLRTKEAPAAVEELTDEEKSTFEGIEERYMSVEEGALVLHIRLSRPVARTARISAFAFGYRGDRPFVSMPKIHVALTVLSAKVYDQDQVIEGSGIRVRRGWRSVTVRIPLSVLGDPERVLTTARTYLGEVPLDWVSWRVLKIIPGA